MLKNLWINIKYWFNGRVNVKDFGATNDGVSNCTDSFNKAINWLNGRGGTLYLPAGNYIIK